MDNRITLANFSFERSWNGAGTSKI